LASQSYELLTKIVRMSTWNVEDQNRQNGNNPNAAPLANQGLFDAEPWLGQTSFNAPPLTIRSKLVKSLLHTYLPDVPQMHQTFANQKAEVLLKHIVENTNLDFLSSTLTELVLEEESPRLQAVLRMVEARIRFLN